MGDDTQKIMAYIDARMIGDLETAFKIKKEIFPEKRIHEFNKCHICSKFNNKGKVVLDEKGSLVWECQNCINTNFIRNNTLFGGRRTESG